VTPQGGVPRFGRRPAYLRLAWNADGGSKAGALAAPGLTDWDRQFLQQIANWPLPLMEPQRVMLRDIARRAR